MTRAGLAGPRSHWASPDGHRPLARDNEHGWTAQHPAACSPGHASDAPNAHRHSAGCFGQAHWADGSKATRRLKAAGGARLSGPTNDRCRRCQPQNSASCRARFQPRRAHGRDLVHGRRVRVFVRSPGSLARGGGRPRAAVVASGVHHLASWFRCFRSLLRQRARSESRRQGCDWRPRFGRRGVEGESAAAPRGQPLQVQRPPCPQPVCPSCPGRQSWPKHACENDRPGTSAPSNLARPGLEGAARREACAARAAWPVGARVRPERAAGLR